MLFKKKKIPFILIFNVRTFKSNFFLLLSHLTVQNILFLNCFSYSFDENNVLKI